MDEALISEVLKYVGATGAGGVIMAFLLRLAWRKLAEESLAGQRAAWEAEFIASLRAEIERQSVVNRALYEQAAVMHARMIELMSENMQLKAQHLRDDVKDGNRNDGTWQR